MFDYKHWPRKACLGPLHTRAKSHDPEIVKAQKKMSKGHPNTHSKIMLCGQGCPSVVWSHMSLGPQPNVFSMNLLFMRAWQKQNRINHQLWAFEVPWSLDFVVGLHPRDGFWKESKWPWNMIHSMPCRNPCRRYIHLARIHILCWSLMHNSRDQLGGPTWSELGPPAPPFPPMRVLEVKCITGFSLVCEVALSL